MCRGICLGLRGMVDSCVRFRDCVCVFRGMDKYRWDCIDTDHTCSLL